MRLILDGVVFWGFIGFFNIGLMLVVGFVFVVVFEFWNGGDIIF